MAKRVFLIRHAKAGFDPTRYDVWQSTSRLARLAKGQIKKAAKYFGDRGITFSDMWHSPLTRAAHTCQRMAKLMGITCLPGTKENLGPGDVKKWCRLYNKWRQQFPDPSNAPDLGAPECLALWPDLCREEGERVFSAVVEIARELKNGEAAAAFSHDPLVRLAQYAATGSCEGPKIGNCQAVCFIFEGNRFVGCEDHLI